MTTSSTPSAIDPHPRRRVEVDGLEMSYVDTGTGDPIVFLHGNPTSAYLWRNVIPHVADLGRCLAPDLIGHGDSAKAPGYNYRFVDHVRWLDEWFDAVGATADVHLVVHDWGSGLGFHRAKRFPDQIASITYMEALVQPRPWEGFGDGEAMFRALRSARGEEMATYRAPYPTRESRIPTLLWAREIPVEGETRPADVAGIVTDYAAFMRDSPIPKLFVRADPGNILHAPGTEVDHCRTWPHQREVVVPGVHFLQEDSPDRIGQALRAFLHTV